jgi:hypothetical protein
MGDKKATRKALPELRPGKYADGHPLDDIGYVESKIILKPDRFGSAKAFWDYAALVKAVAKKNGVGFSYDGYDRERPQVREVVFLDGEDFRLYRNGFILRRRIQYRDGFPVGEPEIVFKYRVPDLQKAAEADVRPVIDGPYEIKFKLEVLPLRDEVGGVRTLYSHNAQFPLSSVHAGDRTRWSSVSKALPVLATLKKGGKGSIELVNHTIVEEILQDIGVLDFGKGVTAKANVALWRERGEHRPLVAEFAFQVKFKRRDELHAKAVGRAEQFFVSLQLAATDWVLLGVTKTGVVYGLRGSPPSKE